MEFSYWQLSNQKSREENQTEQNLLLRARSFGIFRNKNIHVSRNIFGYSAPGSRIAGMEIQVFRNENSSRTNAYSHYSNYSYSGLIPNERALSLLSKIWTVYLGSPSPSFSGTPKMMFHSPLNCSGHLVK